MKKKKKKKKKKTKKKKKKKRTGLRLYVVSYNDKMWAD